MRCKPDDLAKIIRSASGNEGRMLTVDRRAQSMAELPLGTGNAWLLNRDDLGPLWLCTPLQPLRATHRIFDDQPPRLEMRPVIFPDSWLEPIRDGLPGEQIDRRQDREMPVGEGYEVLTVSDGIAHA